MSWESNHICIYASCTAATCGGAMCCSKLRCACGTHFGSNFWCACVWCILRLAKCNHNIAHYFGNNERTDNWLKYLVFWCKLQYGIKIGVIFTIFQKKKEKKIGEVTYRYWNLKQYLKTKILNQMFLYSKVVVWVGHRGLKLV